MEIRLAEEKDLDGLMRLINQAFAVERFFLTGDRLDPASTREYFSRGTFLMAEEQSALAASVYVEMRGDRSYLGLLAVDPSRQKTGLGRRMVAAAEEFARELGSRAMDMTVVNLRVNLPPFYEKLGYAEVGTAPIRPEMLPRVTQACHFIRMSKALR